MKKNKIYFNKDNFMAAIQYKINKNSLSLILLFTNFESSNICWNHFVYFNNKEF